MNKRNNSLYERSNLRRSSLYSSSPPKIGLYIALTRSTGCRISPELETASSSRVKQMTCGWLPLSLTSLDVGDLEYRSLEAFERNYRSIPTLNYVWFQCHFHVAAKNVFASGGIPAVQRFWWAFAEPQAELDDLIAFHLAAWRNP